MKKSLFDSLFSSESRVYSLIFLCLAKVHFMALYSGKLRVWGGSQMMWDSLHTDLNAKSFPFI